MFLIPSATAGRSLIDEIFKLLNNWIEGTALSNVAFKVVMIMLVITQTFKELKS